MTQFYDGESNALAFWHVCTGSLNETFSFEPTGVDLATSIHYGRIHVLASGGCMDRQLEEITVADCHNGINQLWYGIYYESFYFGGVGVQLLSRADNFCVTEGFNCYNSKPCNQAELGSNEETDLDVYCGDAFYVFGADFWGIATEQTLPFFSSPPPS